MNIGIIGLGDMGCLYARSFAEAGYSVYGCDLAGRIVEISDELTSLGVVLSTDGKSISRKCDVIFYSVEAEKIADVVEQYGGSTKYGAIVSGQTSVKYPEIQAFEKYLPKDVNIISCHSLHGPGTNTNGQKLIVIPYRTSNEAYKRMADVLSVLKSDIIEIGDYNYHDKILADTQALTHFGFKSIGTAWKEAGVFPWENASYAGGIDNIKILTTLRIFSQKAHIYGGLAILNPHARAQIRQYRQSESELFKLMIKEGSVELRKRLYKARDFIFHQPSKSILLSNDIIREFSLPSHRALRKPNSHLSLLSMVDAWYHLGINPYHNLICETPPFKLRLGIAELLFQNEELLEESIETSLYDKSIRAHDLEFHSAVREWSSLIIYGNMQGYQEHFNRTKLFFKDMLDQGKLQSAELVRRLN